MHTDEQIKTITLLAQTFPACFAVYERRRKPLKIGIHADVVAAMADVVPSTEIAAALRYYTRAIHYQRALVLGGVRVDLDGNAAGVVTPEQEADAWEKRRKWVARKANVAAARALEKAALEAAARPKQVTLADLKAAARERAARQSA
jgi:ProP effector